jgi:hypothetical protein
VQSRLSFSVGQRLELMPEFEPWRRATPLAAIQSRVAGLTDLRAIGPNAGTTAPVGAEQADRTSITGLEWWRTITYVPTEEDWLYPGIGDLPGFFGPSVLGRWLLWGLSCQGPCRAHGGTRFGGRIHRDSRWGTGGSPGLCPHKLLSVQGQGAPHHMPNAHQVCWHPYFETRPIS